ncbi:MAG TPA: hypothetical protein PLD88_05170, partial [Candidatus Berkiella sp.]|nr:hypothetical protein [Candidatus Berkiella sp.]
MSTPANLHELLLQEKFGLIESVPCMYCDLSAIDTELHHADIFVEELLSSDNLLKWIQPICEGFEAKDGGEAFRQLNEQVCKETGVFKQFIAYLEGEVVSSGTLFL